VTEPLSVPDHVRVAENRIVLGEGRAQREERDEGYPAGVALLEHGHRGAVSEVERILYAGNISVLESVQQVLAGDVAEADAADQAVLTRLCHGRELIVEALVRCGSFSEAQVDGGQSLDLEAPQVLLDALRRRD